MNPIDPIDQIDPAVGLPYGGDALDWDLLRRLSDVRGVSGDEGRVRDLLAAHVEPHVDRLWTDDIGNLYAAKRGEGAQDRVGGSVGDRLPSGPVMLCAHLDEVGLIVTDVDADGMVRFAAVGGVLGASVVGQRVAVGPDGMPGVIGLPPAHATAEAARGRLPALAELRIDLGVTTRDAALERVGIGDAVVWDTAVVDLGPTLLGKAFDDRAGCWALAMLLERRFPVDVVAVWSVQEETGLRGAGIAAHRLRPSAAIVLECGTTDDTPKERDETPVMRVGDGPAITVVDAVMVADERLVAHLAAAAARAGVRHQIRAPKGGGTDGGRIHLAREGVPTAVVSAPCRYLHGPLALVSKHDLAGVVALVRAALDAWPDAARAMEVHR